jgi:transposase InsO family protein
MQKGFMYLCAVIDVHKRYVVGWGLSNSMTAEWVVGIISEAILLHGRPEILNSDQGSQFTSELYVSLLIKKEISISEYSGVIPATVPEQTLPLIPEYSHQYGRQGQGYR